jgi:3-deoxy-D-manno-octulosonic-acid transferase
MARSLSLVAYSAFSARTEASSAHLLDQLVQSRTITDEVRNHRLAQNLPERPKGRLIWMTAGTNRAVPACLELFRRLRENEPDLHGILTTTFNAPASDALPDGLYMMQAPEERLPIIRRFLTHWTPDCLIWVGGGFRPALIEQAHIRGIPAISIDAPNSLSTLAISQIIPGLRTATMALFEHVFAANASQSIPWHRAGLNSDHIEVLGYLEEGTTVPQFDEAELETLSAEIGTRPVWVAAHIAAGEISAVMRAHKAALRRAHRLLLVVSAQDPDMIPLIETYCTDQGLKAVSRPNNAKISEAVQVLIVNAGSEDGLWYRLAPVSFLGQSITNGGGTDPYPAAAFGSAIVHGPNVANHTIGYARFRAAKATRLVKCGTSLGDAINELLAPDSAALMASAAWNVCSTGAEMTDRVADLTQDILDMREEMLA